jgi:hypothetical protein
VRRKKKKHLWTSSEDLQLLREVAVTRPFIGKYKEIPQKWSTVIENLPQQWPSDIKATRARFDVLLAKFSSDERRSLIR